MKATRAELWLLRNDPEIREAPRRPEGIPAFARALAPLGAVDLTEHKRACIALTGRGEKYCVCAAVPDDPPVELPPG